MLQRQQLEDDNIWLACSEGRVDAVIAFLNNMSYNVEQRDENGYCPLHGAVSYDHTELVKVLLSQYGANADARDIEDGDSVLHVAISLEMCRVLLQVAPALLLARNKQNLLPIEVQSREGNEEIVEFLADLMPVEVDWTRLEEEECDDTTEKIDLETLQRLLNPDNHEIIGEMIGDQDILMSEE